MTHERSSERHDTETDHARRESSALPSFGEHMSMYFALGLAALFVLAFLVYGMVSLLD